ncbi:MAG TPA: hypothetical protein VKA19_00090 [Alphaproteobacteria bacterium]|nr:hypothetical protein [Alphaproteobacteria bacterium]
MPSKVYLILVKGQINKSHYRQPGPLWSVNMLGYTLVCFRDRTDAFVFAGAFAIMEGPQSVKWSSFDKKKP